MINEVDADGNGQVSLIGSSFHRSGEAAFFGSIEELFAELI